MLLVMAVSFYSVRWVMSILGVIDFGIYNLVAGIVSMFALLTHSLTTAANRFFSYEIGKNNNKLNEVFNTTLLILLLFILILFIFCETIGLWIIKNKINIPNSKYDSALFVYQFAILALIFQILKIPYTALIISHEKMNVFAYLSIFQAILSLIMIYFLKKINCNKLELYSVLVLIMKIIDFINYFIFCNKKYKTCKVNFKIKKSTFFSITNFIFWNLFSSVAGIFKQQGLNFMLNIYFGPVVNASRSISSQVSMAINTFSQNFTTAMKPQIVKKFADNNINDMFKLIFTGSKITYFLMWVVASPFLMNIDYVLSLWLHTIPQYAIIFTQLSIIEAIIESISYPIVAGAHATGKIKRYQSVIGVMHAINLPLSCLALYIKQLPEITLIISIIISFSLFFIRLILLKKIVDFDIVKFVKNVFLKSCVATVISFICLTILKSYTVQSFYQLVVYTVVSILINFVIFYLLVFNQDEKNLIIHMIQRIARRKNNVTLKP